jgi:hypothetical protein
MGKIDIANLIANTIEVSEAKGMTILFLTEGSP